jgi:hypothetical protein
MAQRGRESPSSAQDAVVLARVVTRTFVRSEHLLTK